MIAAVQQAAGRTTTARAVTGESFAAHYEQAFADATDARLLNQLEDYEVRRLVQERSRPCGGEISDAEFSLLKELLPAAIANELRLVCSSQFLRETRLPAAEWQRARQRLLVIHDHTPLPHLLGRCIHGAFWTKPLQRRLRSRQRVVGSPREIFARCQRP